MGTSSGKIKKSDESVKVVIMAGIAATGWQLGECWISQVERSKSLMKVLKSSQQGTVPFKVGLDTMLDCVELTKKVL